MIGERAAARPPLLQVRGLRAAAAARVPARVPPSRRGRRAARRGRESTASPILIADVDGELHAVANRCGETPLPLHFGTLAGAELRCSWHGCRYDVRTGQRLDGGRERLAVFPVAVDGDEIRVAVGVEPATTDAMDPIAPLRTLVAGFGNVLRGDDGFGVAVIHRLQARGPAAGVNVIEIGTAGIRLAQELLTPYDRLMIVDAMARGGAPGTVYVVAVERWRRPGEVDLHLAVPSRALAVAKALGALPRRGVHRGLRAGGGRRADHGADAGGPGRGGHRARAHRPAAARRPAAQAAPASDRLERMRQRDEILQIMFWLHAEGLGPDVAAGDMLRFVDDDTRVRATLRELVQDGYADVVGDGPEPRYRLTPPGSGRAAAASWTSSSRTWRRHAPRRVRLGGLRLPHGRRRRCRDLG